MEDITHANRESTQKAIDEIKMEIDSELSRFKKEVVSLLESLTDDVKHLRKAQAQGIKFDGKHVVHAVQSVGRKGGALLKAAEGQAVKSLGHYTKGVADVKAAED
jgi:hypothetical protein